MSAGSSDRLVYIWDTTSRRPIYKLPGHAGSVNEVDFHPTEPIGLYLWINLYLSFVEKISDSNTINNRISANRNAIEYVVCC